MRVGAVFYMCKAEAPTDARQQGPLATAAMLCSTLRRFADFCPDFAPHARLRRASLVLAFESVRKYYAPALQLKSIEELSWQ